MTDKERDDAMLAYASGNFPGNTFTVKMLFDEILRLERANWQPAPKPDRAKALAQELWVTDSGTSWSVWTTIIRRHFDELRAEWEAEREDQAMEPEPKPDRWTLAWEDANRASLYSRELQHDSDQAAVEVLRRHFPERPAVVMPEDVAAWARSIVANSVGFITATPIETAARFILSLDGVKGGG